MREQREERDKGWLLEGKPGETWENSLDGIDSDNTPGWKISDASLLEGEDEKVSPTPFFPYPLTVAYPQGANTQEGPLERHDGSPFAVAISFRSFRSLAKSLKRWREGGHGEVR